MTRSFGLFFVSFVVFLCGSAGAFAVDTEGSPRFLVHLLDYIALDYAGAVQRGKVVSQSEYEEQLEFAANALQTAKALPLLPESQTIIAGLQDLRGLIAAKAGIEQIRSSCREIESAVIRASHLQISPTHWPNRAEGKPIFAANCTMCHGSEGRGDGRVSQSLDPKPSDFHDPKLAEMPPFQIFNAIRLGVPGTSMPAFPQFSDQEIWDLAFYVLSFRYEGKAKATPSQPSGLSLQQVATLSDDGLRPLLPGDARQKEEEIARIRLYTPASEDADRFLLLARTKLEEALSAYGSGQLGVAKKSAVMAYLDGVEPIEPRLRVKDASFTAELELRMAEVRGALQSGEPFDSVRSRVRKAEASLAQAEAKLQDSQASPWVTFTVSAGIFLREGFEAILILITLLGMLKSLGSRRAVLYVHAGWMLAVGVGVLTWLFSGWLVNISGAQREIIEGSISAFAVVVLLYFGFWLHRKTEIGKWRAFLQEMVQAAVQEKNLIGLGTVAFMAVFREIFEVVLFLRVLMVESGEGQAWVMFLGVAVSFLLIVGLATALVRFSARLPLRQLFAVSSGIMILLSFILMGKAVHSFQETGWLPVTTVPLGFQSDLIGLYPTYESLLPQLVLLLAVSIFWWISRRHAKLKSHPSV